MYFGSTSEMYTRISCVAIAQEFIPLVGTRIAIGFPRGANNRERERVKKENNDNGVAHMCVVNYSSATISDLIPLFPR